jgi:hypothetical protein
MTEPDALTAVLLQLSDLTRQLTGLDHREAADIRALNGRITGLTTLVSSLKAAATDQAETFSAIKALDQRVEELAARITSQSEDDPGAYEPCPSRRWWKLQDEAREASAVSLRAWVEQIYLPGYGHLAASLGDCWEQHPLCLYALDWLSELWAVLYLPSKRTRPALAGQAEWQTRLLPAVAGQLAAETRRCSHTITPPRQAARPAHRP